MVECNYSHGWDNAEWNEDGEPWLFDSKEEAQAEINDLCSHMKDYDSEDYRVVEVNT